MTLPDKSFVTYFSVLLNHPLVMPQSVNVFYLDTVVLAGGT